MLAFTSIMQKSISEYNKSPSSEGSIIKVYHAWMLCKVAKKYLLNIPYDDSQIEEKNVLWKKLLKESSPTKRNVLLMSTLSPDIREIYETLSMLKEEENKMLADIPQQLKKISGSIGIEVYD